VSTAAAPVAGCLLRVPVAVFQVPTGRGYPRGVYANRVKVGVSPPNIRGKKKPLVSKCGASAIINRHIANNYYVCYSIPNKSFRKGREMAEQTRYERYKDAIVRANKTYMADKHQIKVTLTEEEYTELKEYCKEQGKSTQGFIRELVFSAIRS
jgi:hypothetical protein